MTKKPYSTSYVKTKLEKKSKMEITKDSVEMYKLLFMEIIYLEMQA